MVKSKKESTKKVKDKNPIIKEFHSCYLILQEAKKYLVGETSIITLKHEFNLEIRFLIEKYLKKYTLEDLKHESSINILTDGLLDNAVKTMAFGCVSYGLDKKRIVDVVSAAIDDQINQLKRDKSLKNLYENHFLK